MVATYIWPLDCFCILFLLAACHSSCLTCVGPEPSQCAQCKKPDEGLQVEQLSGANITSGECLSQCRAQFYLDNTGLCEGEQAWFEEMLGGFWLCSWEILWGENKARRPFFSFKNCSWVLVDGAEDGHAKEWLPLVFFPWWIIDDRRELVPLTPLSPNLHSKKFQTGIISETVWVAKKDPELIVEFHLVFLLICYPEWIWIGPFRAKSGLLSKFRSDSCHCLAYHLQRIDAILNNLTQ